MLFSMLGERLTLRCKLTHFSIQYVEELDVRNPLQLLPERYRAYIARTGCSRRAYSVGVDARSADS